MVCSRRDRAPLPCGLELVPQAAPLWLKLVLRAERLVGERVESAVHSGTYFEITSRAKRSTTKATETVEGVSRRILHLANLPAGTDIRRVREQLSRMERRLVELSKELDEQTERLERHVDAEPAAREPR
jgi:hypothetical protein